MDFYQKLGIKKVINAWGTLTKLGGSLMDPKVFDAMKEAGSAFVDMDELHEKAGNYIASLLGSEAACITCGASAGIAISAAACMTGTNKGYILQLPDTTNLKNEVLMLKAHRNLYDQALMLSGAKIVELGYTSFSNIEMVENAISEKTAMFFYSSEASSMRGSLSVETILPVLKSHGIPMVVDAAAEVPPVENITKYLKAGADLVVFSGGKEIRGPQSSGFILGKSELIKACDENCCPHHSIGRSMKIDKENIAGIVRAVELFCDKDYDSQMTTWHEWVIGMYEETKALPNVKSKIGYPTEPGVQPDIIPRLYLTVDGFESKRIQDLLFNLEPAVRVGIESGWLAVNPQCLLEEELDIVVSAIRKVVKELEGK